MKKANIKVSEFPFRKYTKDGITYLEGDVGQYNCKYRVLDSKYFTDEKELTMPLSGKIDRATYDILNSESFL